MSQVYHYTFRFPPSMSTRMLCFLRPAANTVLLMFLMSLYEKHMLVFDHVLTRLLFFLCWAMAIATHASTPLHVSSYTVCAPPQDPHAFRGRSPLARDCLSLATFIHILATTLNHADDAIAGRSGVGTAAPV